MAAPGQEVNVRDAAVPRSAPTDTGAAFFTGFTERGPHQSVHRVRSLRELVDKYGQRVSFGMVHDAVEAYFRSGGATAYISREVGPAPVKATVNIPGTAGNTLVATATSVGDWANAYDVRITGAGPYTIEVLDGAGAVVAASGSLATRDAAVGFLNDHVAFTIGAGSGLPTAGTYSLAGGTDDHTNANATTFAAALGLFDVALGPGQVLAPGRTTSAAHAALLQHAFDRNRFALLDAPDGSNEASLIALAGAARALGSTSEGLAWRGMLLYPWARIPGVTAGTTRTIPYSAIQAGLIAEIDALGNPNVPAAGDRGIATYPLGLTAEFLDELDRDQLNAGGVNLARMINEQIKTYGYRTLVDPANPTWLQANNARLAMAITAQAGVIAEHFVLAQLDGENTEIQRFNGQLAGMLSRFYIRGALFGATADEAYRVNTGPQVNTPETLAAGELHAQLEVKMSPFAERVIVDIVKHPITQAL